MYVLCSLYLCGVCLCALSFECMHLLLCLFAGCEREYHEGICVLVGRLMCTSVQLGFCVHMCVCVCICVSAGAQNVYCCVFVFAYGLSVYTNHAHRHRLAGAYLAENVYVLCTYYFYFVHMSLLACKNLWILKNWKAHVSVVMFVGLWECACTLTHACPFVLAANRFCTAALFSLFSVI